MKLQLLSFPGCPGAPLARLRLSEALRERGLPPDFEEVDVSSPTCPPDLRSWGSPTILVDGKNVGGGQPDEGAACRLYAGPAGFSPAPSTEQLVAALASAGSEAGSSPDPGSEKGKPRPKVDRGAVSVASAALGAVAAAGAAAAGALCCAGPVVIGLIGTSGAVAAAGLTASRPWLLLLAFALLAFATFRLHLARTRGPVCHAPARRWLVWAVFGSALATLAATALPYLLDAFTGPA